MGRGQRRKFIVTQCQKALLLHWYEAVRIIYHRSKSNYLGLLSQYCKCGIYRVSTTADIGNDWLTPQTSVMLHHFSRLLLFSETIDETTSHPFERSNTQILYDLKILKDSESFLAIWWVTFFLINSIFFYWSETCFLSILQRLYNCVINELKIFG